MMKLRTKVIKGSIALTLGEGAAYGFSFVRNIILARLLTKADFGVAAALAIMISTLEFTSKMAVDRVIVQDKAGDEYDFLATAHFVQFVIAVLSVFCMILAAGPLAAIFGLSNERWAFQVLALTPLFKGFENLDVRRMGRELRFVPSAVVEVLPQLLITLAAWPLALWIKDYRVVLFLLLTKFLLSSVTSHLLAERPYRLKFESVYVVRILKFGWPLLANSLLMFGIYQGDRLLVGTYYLMSDLATYSAASTLTLGPGLLFMQIFGSIMLPILARSQDEPMVFQNHYKLSVQLVSAFSAFYAFFIILGAEPLMVLVFGQKYAGGGLILAWLAAANAFRFIRTSAVIAAMSKADSKNPMIANFFRLSSLFLAFLAALSSRPIWVLAAAGLIGELLAFVASLVMLSKRDSIPLAWSIAPAIFATSSIGLAGIGVWFGIHNWNWLPAIGMALFGGVFAAGLLVIFFSESRKQVLTIIQSFQSFVMRSNSLTSVSKN
jgi:O-antigen/teichoic acid export membrane protein